MRSSRKLKIMLAMVFVLVLGIVGTIFTILNQKTSGGSPSVMGQTDITTIPYIISLPSVVGYVGKEYVYDVKYSDNDSNSDSINVLLENAPEWLHIENKHIYGVPPQGSEGSYKFSVKISDGENSFVQENYILIQANEN